MLNDIFPPVVFNKSHKSQGWQPGSYPNTVFEMHKRKEPVRTQHAHLYGWN